MSNYTITTNFGAKDSLPSGNAGKVIKGSEFTTEFTNIQTAIATKADTAGDTFTGVVNFSDDIAVNTNTLFVDVSAAKVGIGTDSPDRQLTIANPTDSADMSFISGNAGNALIYFADTDDDNIGAIGYNHEFNFMNFRTNDLERMRIDSSGNLLVGTTDTSLYNNTSGEGFSVVNNELGIAKSGTCAYFNRMGSDGENVKFFKDGSTVGSISVTGSATAYNTSSDERLKENIADSADAGSKVDAIQIRQFDWKSDGSHQDYGVIAQELVTVAPEAVHQPEESEEMMGVDYSKLVPMLIKEVQSLRSRVAELENA